MWKTASGHTPAIWLMFLHHGALMGESSLRLQLVKHCRYGSRKHSLGQLHFSDLALECSFVIASSPDTRRVTSFGNTKLPSLEIKKLRFKELSILSKSKSGRAGAQSRLKFKIQPLSYRSRQFRGHTEVYNEKMAHCKTLSSK